MEGEDLVKWATSVAASIVVALFIKWIRWLWFLPMNRVRLLHEVGYKHLGRRGHRVDKKVVASDVAMAKKLRKVGAVPPPFPNGWYVIAESHELIPGSVKEVHALAEHFAIFRSTDDDGSVHITDLYCPHLGASFSSGTVQGKCITCPFHSWKFDGTSGHCVEIPSCRKPPPSHGKVKVWQSVEANGLVYVWYHAEKCPPHWFPRQIPHLSSQGSKDWVYQGRTEYQVACHIEDIPENGGDFAHFAAIHRTSILGGGEPSRTLTDFFDVWSSHHEWKAEWKPLDEGTLDEDFFMGKDGPMASDVEDICRRHIARLDLEQKFTLFGKALPAMNSKVVCYQVGPATVELGIEMPAMGYRGVMLQYVLPLEPMLQKLVHVFYTVRTWPAPLAKLVLWAEAILMERDVVIWNNKTYLKQPIYASPDDRRLKQHRKWFAQFYSEHSKRFVPTILVEDPVEDAGHPYNDLEW